MKRRRFFQTVTVAPAVAGVASAQRPAVSASEVPKIAAVAAESAAEPAPRHFTARQFATLRRLCELLQPALGGRPGAIEAGVPEFLDFHVGVSPEPRQTLYTGGLDHVEGEARRLFAKAFAELAPEQAEKVLRPLLAPWTFYPPADARQRFLTELRADVRTATMNSKEMSAAPGQSRRRRGGGAQPYWRPIDPTRG